jgi:hypothetical protein
VPRSDGSNSGTVDRNIAALMDLPLYIDRYDNSILDQDASHDEARFVCMAKGEAGLRVNVIVSCCKELLYEEVRERRLTSNGFEGYR